MTYVPSEVAGIIRSDNIARVLTSDMIYLADPNLEMLFYLKYLNGSLMTYNVEGSELYKMGDELGRLGMLQYNM